MKRPATRQARRPPETRSGEAPWRKFLLPLLALWACALAAYSNSFRTGLPFDNAWVIQQDSRIQAATIENTRLILTEDYGYRNATSGLYRPLTTFTYLINYSIFGGGSDPAGYHRINFALHAVNLALVYFLGLRLFRDFERRSTAAFALGAVWGLHPLLSESITNIVGRADLLAGFGILAGLLCHIQSTECSGPNRRKWVVAFVCATTVGIFSKENAVAVLGVMAAYDLIFRAGRQPFREWWRASQPTYVALAIPLAAYFLLRARVLSHSVAAAVPFTDNPLAGAGFWIGRLTAVKVIGKYLWLLAWPGTLSCDYSFNQIPLVTGGFHNAEDWKAVAALALCMSLAALGVWSYRRQKAICFFISLFFITLAPTANIVILIGSVMAERFLYVPAVAFTGCLVWLILRAAPRSATGAIAIICLAYAARTYVRNFDWQDDRSLWTSAAAASPFSYKAQIHLATAIAQPNGVGMREALRAIDHALAILAPVPDDRNVPQPYSIAGFFYRSQGDALAAKGSVALAPPWYHRALDALRHGERVDGALVRQIRQENAHAAEAGWYPLYLELGETYLRLSDPRQALAALEHGRAINPIPEFFEDMARAYAATDQDGKAEVTLWEGLVVEPNSTKLGAALVDLYRRNDPQSCAIQVENGRANLNLGCAKAHDQLCAAAGNMVRLYEQMGQVGLAEAVKAKAMGEYACPSDAH